MGGGEGVDDLCVYDDGFFDDEIWAKFSDEVFFVVNGVFGLLFEMEAPLCEFDAESIFVELFIKAEAQFFLNFNGGPDDLLGKLCMRMLLVFVRKFHRTIGCLVWTW